eukprot:4434325-Alexandrium_andersonii.AAC.1
MEFLYKVPLVLLFLGRLLGKGPLVMTLRCGVSLGTGQCARERFVFGDDLLGASSALRRVLGLLGLSL